jgi:hypothetical protein
MSAITIMKTGAQGVMVLAAAFLSTACEGPSEDLVGGLVISDIDTLVSLDRGRVYLAVPSEASLLAARLPVEP